MPFCSIARGVTVLHRIEFMCNACCAQGMRRRRAERREDPCQSGKKMRTEDVLPSDVNECRPDTDNNDSDGGASSMEVIMSAWIQEIGCCHLG
jgi:hypothetical protein